MEEGLGEKGREVVVRASLGPFTVEVRQGTAEGLEENVRAALNAVKANVELATEIMGALGKAPVEPAPPAAPPTLAVQPSPVDVGRFSLAEVLNMSKAGSLVDKALVAVYYLFKARAVEAVNTKDLRGAFAEARLSEPTNPSDIFYKLVARGLIREAGEKEGSKAFAITLTGEKEAEARVTSPR